MKRNLLHVEEIVQELQILMFQVAVPCKHKITSADLSTGTDVLVNNELNCSMFYPFGFELSPQYSLYVTSQKLLKATAHS